MLEPDVANLGRAITRLGLEDRFLSNGELKNIPPEERGVLVGGIISEKLNLGRWPGVINMIWGGVGKADVLYMGDRTFLKSEIIKSAQTSKFSHHNEREFENSIKSLAGEKEYDFIFDLISESNLSYEGFISAAKYLPRSYFEGEEGAQRNIVFHQVAGKKALDERRPRAAFSHFNDVKDEESISRIFEALINKQGIDEERDYLYPNQILEQIALSNPELRVARFKRILDGFITGEINLRAKEALEIPKKHRIPITDEERQKLYELAVPHLSAWDIREEHPEDHELSLLWARKNLTSKPALAYQIFQQQKYNGRELKIAVIKGLQAKKGYSGEVDRNRELSLLKVDPEHLRMVYPYARFGLQVDIAQELENRHELAKLSVIAKEKGDLAEAYSLWISAGKGFNDSYMDDLRSQLIQGEIEESSTNSSMLSPSLFFLNRLDSRGYAQATNALLEKASSSSYQEKKSLFSKAHELTSLHDSGKMLNRIRKEMVNVDLRWALREFMGSNYLYGDKKEKVEMDDPLGFKYALGVLSKREGVSKERLKPLIEKYSKGL